MAGKRAVDQDGAQQVPSKKLKPAPAKSRFWDLDQSLDDAAARDLRRLRGKVGVSAPTVEEEACRARTVQFLRKTYAKLCQKHQLKAASPVFFDKWHCAWLCHAELSLGPGNRDPLLPVIEDFAVLDAAMVKALAFLPKEKVAPMARDLHRVAERKAKALPEKLLQLPTGGHATVVQQGKEVTLSFQGQEVQISSWHLRKLWRLFRGPEEAFSDAAFCCLLRYQSVLQKGFQGACTSEVFEALRETFGCRFECFASPLNCHYRWTCSAFLDTDAPFGSLGSFFLQEFRSGAFQLNPPFVDDLVIPMVQKLEDCLVAAEAAKSALTFVVVVCANAGSRSGKAALEAIGASRFLRAQVTCPRNTHEYVDGEQHVNKMIRGSPCESGIFILQSRRAAKTNAATEEKMQRIKASFMGVDGKT
ncbi:unnamed protein product [Cladocopium goreaui]|uniref:PCIF1 WW domain-containing protein n=1 Tax=Cladocopium goreaui TaxID=2562237 RepID=A0A9P1GMI7_9DINO|nr:unnamed protein product [Cladocopium goreaui]